MAAVTSLTTAASLATVSRKFDAVPTLYLIHGFVGVGKTTFSKSLERETGAKRFTHDEWMIERHGDNPQGDFDALYAEVEKDIWALAEAALKNGRDVILDFGFWKRAERDTYKKRGADLGATVTLYNLICADETSRARTLKRTAAKEDGALFIDENALDEFRARFEPVASDEHAVTIQTD